MIVPGIAAIDFRCPTVSVDHEELLCDAGHFSHSSLLPSFLSP